MLSAGAVPRTSSPVIRRNLGLALTLVPFGLGVGALGSVLITHRSIIIAVTSVVLIVLGIVQLLGFGFDISRVLPGVTALRRQSNARTGLFRTLLLGAVGGVAGFCAGPILGAVLTLAMVQGTAWGAGVLLAVYGVGMVVPLVLIAALWHRLGTRGQRFLRGRVVTVFGKRFHSTSLLTGAVIIAVGVLFWTTNGLVGLPTLVSTDLQAWAQGQGAVLANPLFDIAAILVLAGVVLAAWVISRRRVARRKLIEVAALNSGDTETP